MVWLSRCGASASESFGSLLPSASPVASPELPRAMGNGASAATAMAAAVTWTILGLGLCIDMAAHVTSVQNAKNVILKKHENKFNK